MRMDFKALSKLTKSFKIDVGDLHAQGVPAILLGAAAVVLAAGAARTLVSVGPALPETIREIRGLLAAVRPEKSIALSR